MYGRREQFSRVSMTPNEMENQIAEVARMEAELAAARRAAAKALRARRQALGLTLRAVKPRARRSIGMLSDMERGKAWETKLAIRLAKFYGAAA